MAGAMSRPAVSEIRPDWEGIKWLAKIGVKAIGDDQLLKYIIEMLEPTGDDSFFAWNFFDAILQQKEGYSDYRWDGLAAEVLRKDPTLKTKLDEKKAADPKFAANGSAQLEFIYRNSPYYEAGHNRYPVYRLN